MRHCLLVNTLLKLTSHIILLQLSLKLLLLYPFALFPIQHIPPYLFILPLLLNIFLPIFQPSLFHPHFTLTVSFRNIFVVIRQIFKLHLSIFLLIVHLVEILVFFPKRHIIRSQLRRSQFHFLGLLFLFLLFLLFGFFNFIPDHLVPFFYLFLSKDCTFEIIFP